jgi:hypothetical protein
VAVAVAVVSRCIPGTGDDVVPADGSQAEVAQAQAEMKVQVAQAAQAAKMMGKLSAGMERLVSGVLQPKVDWREVLRRFVQKQKNETRTWARPNRRMAALGLHMPSISGETLGEITFAIDCSGSIGQKELDEFAAEIKFVWEDMLPFKLHVVYFDSEVCHYDKFERGDDCGGQASRRWWYCVQPDLPLSGAAQHQPGGHHRADRSVLLRLRPCPGLPGAVGGQFRPEGRTVG